MADLDYDSALTLSATAMRRAMESEDKTFAIVSAIDSLRLALLAAERDLADAIDYRAALANGTQVSVLDDEDDDEPCDGNCGHCGGYFCEAHNLHISCSHPDYDLLVDEHEALHSEEQDEAAAKGHVLAATEISQYLDTVETALQDPKFAAAAATRRLIRVVRAGIAAGAAPAMLTALLAEEADQ